MTALLGALSSTSHVIHPADVYASVVFSRFRACAAVTPSFGRFLPHKKKPSSQPPSPPGPGQPRRCFVAVDLQVLDFSCRWTPVWLLSLASCFQGPPVWWLVPVFHPFVLPSPVAPGGRAGSRACSSLEGRWVVLTSGRCNSCCCEHRVQVFVCTCPGVELPGHVVTWCLSV